MASTKAYTEELDPKVLEIYNHVTSERMDQDEIFAYIEEAVDELTPAQITSLYRYLVPDGKSSSTCDGYLAMVLINLREAFMTRYVKISIIGFLFRMVEEYEGLMGYELDGILIDKPRREVIQLKQKIVKSFLMKTFGFDPIDIDNYPRPMPSTPYKEFDDYFKAHEEDIKTTAKLLYGDKPDFDWYAYIMDSFDAKSIKEAKEFAESNTEMLGLTVKVIPHGKRAFLAPTKKNRERENFVEEKSKILKNMQSKLLKEQEVAKKMLAHRTTAKRTSKESRRKHRGKRIPK